MWHTQMLICLFTLNTNQMDVEGKVRTVQGDAKMALLKVIQNHDGKIIKS